MAVSNLVTKWLNVALYNSTVFHHIAFCESYGALGIPIWENGNFETTVVSKMSNKLSKMEQLVVTQMVCSKNVHGDECNCH